MSRTATQTNMEDTAVNPTTSTAPRSGSSGSGPPGDSAVPVAEASPSENLESTTGSSTPAHDSEDHPSNGDQGPSTAPEEEEDPSGISTDRFKTVNQTTKPVLYQLEWRDKRNRTKPSFYSSEPFTNLNVVEDTVSAQYQSKDVQKKHIAIEIITRIRGTAARDEKDDSGPVYIDNRPGQRPRPYPEPPLPLGPQIGSPPPAFPGPDPFSPLPTYDIYGNEVPREEQSNPPAPPAPYKLEEVAIKHIGQTRVIVHSLHLMKVLRSIVNYYPMQNLHKSKTTISEPFSVLIHHYAELKAFSITGPDLSKDEDQDQEEGNDKQDQVEKMIEHTKILLDFLEPHYDKFFETAEDRLTRDIPLARYEELWYLFRPGTDVYFKMYSKQMAGVVVGCKYADTDYIESLELRVWYLLFDGKVARRKARSLIIYKYQGEEEVTELTVYPSKPWDFKDGGKRRKAFETRGQEVFQLCKNRFKQVYYNGKLTAEEDPATFKGLVIIDNDPINDYTTDHPDDGSTSSRSRSRSRGRSVSTAPSSQYLDDSDGSSISSRLTDSDTDLPPPPPPPGDVAIPPPKAVKRNKRDDSMWSKYKNVTVDSPNLTAHHYFLVMPFIEGFAVLQKKWRTFDIDCMSEVPRREEILDNVVMESTKQAIIRAISHPQSHAWKLDFIQGKGEGQIVLLHGPPGVGKTYTVECAAEATGRPLIFLTIADIGLDERRIEEQMTKWFSLAERWEAILLIDEADIFLERRRGADIARNGLVSVFLRKMEYFRGLLFLTTNRIGQIDDAFLSRIHVVIGYTPLDETKRKRIWNGFFQKLERDMKSPKTTGPKVVVSKYAKQYVLNDEEVKNLQWNGREIRNAFQTAISLAGYEAAKDPDWTEEKGVDVEREHFESVVAMSREFHDYMDSITQQPESERARSRFERNDGHLGVGGSGSG